MIENPLSLFCDLDITNQKIQKLYSRPPFQSNNIIMAFLLPPESKHQCYCFRQHCGNNCRYSPVFSSDSGKRILMWLCLLPLFSWNHHSASPLPDALRRVGGSAVDASTMALGGIPTDLHMAWRLLWWLRGGV